MRKLCFKDHLFTIMQKHCIFVSHNESAAVNFSRGSYSCLSWKSFANSQFLLDFIILFREAITEWFKDIFTFRKKIEDIPEQRRHRLLHLLNPRFPILHESFFLVLLWFFVQVPFLSLITLVCNFLGTLSLYVVARFDSVQIGPHIVCRLISRAWAIAGTRYDDAKLAKKCASNLLSGEARAKSLEYYYCRTSEGTSDDHLAAASAKFSLGYFALLRKVIDINFNMWHAGPFPISWINFFKMVKNVLPFNRFLLAYIFFDSKWSGWVMAYCAFTGYILFEGGPDLWAIYR